MNSTILRADHPLAEISYIPNWNKWREVWDSSTLAEVRLGLLHYGFGVDLEYQKRTDRISFYLDVADGHADPRSLETERERSAIYASYSKSFYTPLGLLEGKGFAPVRQKVAEKAFAMVALNVFKPVLKHDDRDDWALVTGSPLLEKLLYFFRPDNESVWHDRLVNFPFVGHRRDSWSVPVGITWDFLMRFCTFVLTFRYFGSYEGENDRETRKRFEFAWPLIVEILFYTRQTRQLLDEKFVEVWRDERCVRKLEELVMGTELNSFPGVKIGPPASLEEAISRGSEAAATLNTLKIKKAEMERVEKLNEAERMRREAEERIADLSQERGTSK